MIDFRDDKGRFAEGNAGRPKGAANKTSREAAEKILRTLDELDEREPYKSAGGYAFWLAVERPDLFVSLVRTILPRDMSVAVQSDSVTDLIVALRAAKEATGQ